MFYQFIYAAKVHGDAKFVVLHLNAGSGTGLFEEGFVNLVDHGKKLAGGLEKNILLGTLLEKQNIIITKMIPRK